MRKFMGRVWPHQAECQTSTEPAFWPGCAHFCATLLASSLGFSLRNPQNPDIAKSVSGGEICWTYYQNASKIRMPRIESHNAGRAHFHLVIFHKTAALLVRIDDASAPRDGQNGRRSAAKILLAMPAKKGILSASAAGPAWRSWPACRSVVSPTHL
jgi:hypothetical protein